MMRSRLFGALQIVGIAAASLHPARAQDVPAALDGYSMIGDRVETIYAPNSTFNQHWTVRAYLSRGGRVFAKQTLVSENPHNQSGTTATISSDGSQAPFRWDGAGISRQWTNPKNGVVLRLSETVVQTGRGPSCRMSLDRENITDFSVRVVRQSCRMFRGNAVAE